MLIIYKTGYVLWILYKY